MAGTVTANTPSAPLSPGRLVDLSFSLTADSSNSIPPIVFNGAVILLGGRLVFDSVAPPNSLSFPINSQEGVAVVASQTLTQSGPIVLTNASYPFPSGFSIPFTGNTNPGAKFKMFISVIAG